MRTRVTIIWLPVAQNVTERILGMNQLPYWPIASLLLVPVVLYLGLRAYRIFTRDSSTSSRHAEQTGRTAPGDDRSARARDRRQGRHGREPHPPRADLRHGCRARARDDRGRGAGGEDGRAAPRHRQARRPGPHPLEAGPAHAEEFQKVQAHPQVGADIIATVPFPYPVAPLILSHHERWDGRGYPRGLKGEDIPLGARILCLVDYFDALTSNSPVSRGDGGSMPRSR